MKFAYSHAQVERLVRGNLEIVPPNTVFETDEETMRTLERLRAAVPASEEQIALYRQQQSRRAAKVTDVTEVSDEADEADEADEGDEADEVPSIKKAVAKAASGTKRRRGKSEDL